MGANFNYRLIFLLFTVPGLFALSWRSERGYARAGRVVLLTLLAFWLPWSANPLNVAVESVLSWLLFALFASVCLATLYSLFPARIAYREAAAGA